MSWEFKQVSRAAYNPASSNLPSLRTRCKRPADCRLKRARRKPAIKRSNVRRRSGGVTRRRHSKKPGGKFALGSCCHFSAIWNFRVRRQKSLIQNNLKNITFFLARNQTFFRNFIPDLSKQIRFFVCPICQKVCVMSPQNVLANWHLTVLSAF